jgi:transcriptional regulator with GAF, ATPase, and Fis domain
MSVEEYHSEQMLASKADEIKIPVLETDTDKDIFLSISDSIARVRKREDLLRFVNDKLKALLPFELGEIEIIDKRADAYKSAYFDFSPNTITEEFNDYLNAELPSNNFIADASKVSSGPLVFNLEELLHEGKLPPYLQANYQAGIRELVILLLKNEKENIGYFRMFAKHESFQPVHLKVLPAISSLITIAVENVLTNEEILERENEKSMLLLIHCIRK